MQELRERLLSQVERVAGPLDSECWIFQTSTGHANLWWQGLTSRASRHSFKAFVGAIKDGNYVLHKCDVPGCVNPDHLWQGSPQDNVQDAIAKGRFDPTRWRRRHARISLQQ